MIVYLNLAIASLLFGGANIVLGMFGAAVVNQPDILKRANYGILLVIVGMWLYSGGYIVSYFNLFI